MASDRVLDEAQRALAPGDTIGIGNDALSVEIAPAAGGRIAQITCDGIEWLVGHDDANAAAIAWGSYPMLPWAGRIRGGGFDFDGRHHQLPLNLGGHAIHGVGFDLPWQVEAHSPAQAELSLRLPEDARWPFGGSARQRIAVEGDALRLELSVSAGGRAMPMPAIGWHPWFRKPDRLDFHPDAFYPRDTAGIATLPLAPPPAGPWDDCFINRQPVVLHRGHRRLQLSSDCEHWVVFDEPAHATCVEPQSGPPDVFNLAPDRTLAPGQTLAAWFLLEWH